VKKQKETLRGHQRRIRRHADRRTNHQGSPYQNGTRQKTSLFLETNKKEGPSQLALRKKNLERRSPGGSFRRSFAGHSERRQKPGNMLTAKKPNTINKHKTLSARGIRKKFQMSRPKRGGKERAVTARETDPRKPKDARRPKIPVISDGPKKNLQVEPRRDQRNQ